MSQPFPAKQTANITGGRSPAGSLSPSPELLDDQAILSDLMIEYQGGSLAALTDFYARVSPYLTGFLLSIVENSRTAEQLVEETFLEVHRARHTYTPPRPVIPWLCAIARHLAIRHLRARDDRGR